MFVVGVGVALVVHRRFGWVPVPYLFALVAVPGVGWRSAGWRDRSPGFRCAATAAAALAFVALLPVPWMTANVDDPPGNAWRLDGRVSINGDRLDPPGTWYWLTVGRPPIVAELVRDRFVAGPTVRPINRFAGRRSTRPAFSEPAAAAVGLRRAGWTLPTRIIVEVSEPFDTMLPARAVLTHVNGLVLTTRADWLSGLADLRAVNIVEVEGGGTFEFSGTAMPFRRVELIELPVENLDVLVGGALAATLPGSWYRNLSLGSSHGLMVALVAYVYGSDHDLARGRAIAGTGKMLPDGTVGEVGGLRGKARAARDVGADVFLFPAPQAAQLDGFEAGPMRLFPVGSLDDAIVALSVD
jgi:hypothetical protein